MAAHKRRLEIAERSSGSEDDLEKLSMADIEAAMSMSVTDAMFTSVLANYPVGAHIQCRCQVSDAADLAAGCWVGLFKVGWANAEADCVCRAECRRESERVLAAVFSPGQLPSDTRDFYQFCFAAPGGLVKGASTPFLFRAAPADDFVAELDEELQGVVVSARTAQLESELATMRLEQAAQRSAAEDATERLRTELTELAERLSAAETRAAEAETRAAEAESDAGRLRVELRRQEDWRQAQAARLVDAEDERQRLLRRLEEATRDADAAGDQANAARQSLELHSAERQRLVEELQACHCAADDLGGQLRSAIQELEAARQREKMATDLLAETQAAVDASEAAAVAKLAQCEQEVQQLRAHAQQQQQQQLSENQQLQQQLAQSEHQIGQLLEELQQLRHNQQEAAAAATTTAELQAQAARYASLLTAYEGVKKQFHSAKDRERLMKIKYDDVIDCNKQMLQREERLHHHASDLQERLKQGAIEYKRLMKKLRDTQQQLRHLQQQQQQAAAEPAEVFHDALGGDDDTDDDREVAIVTVIHRPPRLDAEEESERPLIALGPASPASEFVRVCPLCNASGFESQTDYEEHVHGHFGEIQG